MPNMFMKGIPLSKTTTATGGDDDDALSPDSGAGTTKPLTPPPPDDPFNLEKLRLTQDFAAQLGVKKVRTTLPVRKPDKTWFVRIHPDPSYRLETYVLELKEENEMYLVSPALWDELATESTISPRLLVTAVTRQNLAFLWPMRLPSVDGKLDEWSRSALEAAKLADTAWVRVQSNTALGAYEVSAARATLSEPDWCQLVAEPFQDLLKIAFRGRYIDDLAHPVLKRLRGDV